MQAPQTRKTTLSANVVAFCRYLRRKGYSIGPAEEAEALRALDILGPFDQSKQMQLCLRAMLARSPKQLLLFDELYEQYWRELDRAVDSKLKDGNKQEQKSTPSKAPSLQALKSWLYGEETQEETELATYSPGQVLTQKDFSMMSKEEAEEVMKLIRRIAQQLAMRESRRHARSKRGAFDLRRTIRMNMRRGGEILDFAYSKPGRRRLNMVLICDVSRSMDLYSRFLIQFIYAFQHLYKRIETFVFSTALQCVSPELRHLDFEKAMQQLSERVTQWSGGTRIGESLHSFVETYGRRLLDARTQVIILSDGWDTGEVELLGESMRQIQRKARRVVWLNPLAGRPDYQPSVAGMEAAMPYIDLFAAAHNIDSLRKIIGKL